MKGGKGARRRPNAGCGRLRRCAVSFFGFVFFFFFCPFLFFSLFFPLRYSIHPVAPRRPPARRRNARRARSVPRRLPGPRGPAQPQTRTPRLRVQRLYNIVISNIQSSAVRRFAFRFFYNNAMYRVAAPRPGSAVPFGSPRSGAALRSALAPEADGGGKRGARRCRRDNVIGAPPPVLLSFPFLSPRFSFLIRLLFTLPFGLAPLALAALAARRLSTPPSPLRRRAAR